MAAGVIFLRAATNAAATWRVAAVLVLVFVVFVATVGAASAAFFFVGISAFREVSTAAFVAPAVLDLETLDLETLDLETLDFEALDFETDASSRGDGVRRGDGVPASAGGNSAFSSRRSLAFEGVAIADFVSGALLVARAAARGGLAADAFPVGDVVAADFAGAPREPAALPAAAREGCADALFGPPRTVRLPATTRSGAGAANFAAAARFGFSGVVPCFGLASGFGLALRTSRFIRDADSDLTARAADPAPPRARGRLSRPVASGEALPVAVDVPVAEDFAADLLFPCGAMSLAFWLRVVAPAFAFGGMGSALLIGDFAGAKSG